MIAEQDTADNQVDAADNKHYSGHQMTYQLAHVTPNFTSKTLTQILGEKKEQRASELIRQKLSEESGRKGSRPIDESGQLDEPCKAGARNDSFSMNFQGW